MNMSPENNPPLPTPNAVIFRIAGVDLLQLLGDDDAPRVLLVAVHDIAHPALQFRGVYARITLHHGDLHILAAVMDLRDRADEVLKDRVSVAPLQQNVYIECFQSCAFNPRQGNRYQIHHKEKEREGRAKNRRAKREDRKGKGSRIRTAVPAAKDSTIRPSS